LPRFQGRSTIKTWLFTIVINEARGRLRKTKREFSMEDHAGGEHVFGSERFQENGHWAREPTRWHHHSPEALLSHEDFRRCLEMTLQTLPELQRSVLTLWELRGLEAGDICNILSISASNLRVLLHRARSRVYAMVEHYEETGTC
ncbi:MAG: sigma-70 family RNA polymerase sigma factor, partial [Lysobacterales bacterium]|jgi:RNA polymerase sigma-70 factor (ECF subfamily)